MSETLPAPFEWCPIPAGKVTLSDDRQYGGTEGGIFDVPAFSIAKYPVTYAQFQVFVAEGYADPQWWGYSAEASMWREAHEQPKVSVIDGVGDYPCGGVSWYEAVAFCRWLNARLGGVQQVTLPSEQQWQRAAQGDDNRMFPWGNDFDSKRCNTRESGIGQTTAATAYPLGASPFGVVDMSGNIWEWCLTQWGRDRVDLGSDSPRCGHGGAYSLSQDDTRVGFRCGVSPSLQIGHI
ncbi:MAG: SUMF1/EgtB/PvdO family nonheme iron enzyme, partial [Chloroflexota bacterium]